MDPMSREYSMTRSYEPRPSGSGLCRIETTAPSRSRLVEVVVASALLITSGCKVGPNYQAPHVETLESFANAVTQPTTGPSTSPTTNQSIIDREHAPWIDWWTKFDDHELDALVIRALAANHELAIARARVQEARAV